MLLTRGHRTCLAICLCLAASAPSAQEETPAVEAVSVERRSIISEVAITGTVRAPRSSRVSVSIAGLVLEAPVDVGDRIAEGDVLLRLDDTLARVDVRTAEADVRAGQVRSDEAERLRREAEAVGARANIPETELRAREHAVRLARAELSSRQALMERQRELLERHVVTAPFDGVVTTRQAETGQWVEPGDELLQLVDVDNVELEFHVPQDVFHRVTTDAALTVRFDAGDSESRSARILRIVPVTDPQARTFRLRATVDGGPRPAAGMSVSGLLRLPSGERGLAVPRRALNRYPEGRVTVWVVVEEDGARRVREQRVHPGTRFGDLVEVEGRVSSGDQVVVTGNAGLRDGQRVTVR